MFSFLEGVVFLHQDGCIIRLPPAHSDRVISFFVARRGAHFSGTPALEYACGFKDVYCLCLLRHVVRFTMHPAPQAALRVRVLDHDLPKLCRSYARDLVMPIAYYS